MPERSTRRGISIYRFVDAEDLDDTDFMDVSKIDQATSVGMQRMANAGWMLGATAKVLVRQPLDGGGYSLLHGWFKPHYPLLRHSHDADCMYYLISGSIVMGRQELRAGDAFFVPAGAPYQYAAGADGVEVLEIRQGVNMFDIRFSDTSSERWTELEALCSEQSQQWDSDEVSATETHNTL